MPCPELPNPLTERAAAPPIDFEPEPEVPEWSGFTIFSDVHASTPLGDEQQLTQLQLACYIDCDEPECGGPGGWLVWWSNNPDHLAQGCSHPDNPFGYLL